MKHTAYLIVATLLLCLPASARSPLDNLPPVFAPPRSGDIYAESATKLPLLLHMADSCRSPGDSPICSLFGASTGQDSLPDANLIVSLSSRPCSLFSPDAGELILDRVDSCFGSGDSDPAAPEPQAPASAPQSSSRSTAPLPQNSNALLGTEKKPPSVDWKHLAGSSLLYLSFMNGFRIASEPSTRSALFNNSPWGYFNALGAMHGWSDGDSYYENYLGHPIQGAVSSYLWIHNDLRYRNVEFGASRQYWMSRFRAYVFAWAFSEQFEIGLISEASIGQIQRYCCAYGFVDHVITPNLGMIWVVGGDAIDRYVTRRIEDHTDSVALRAAVRVGLNPPQGFANLMNLQYPWHRENRPSPTEYRGQLYPRSESPQTRKPGLVPSLELTGAVPSLMNIGPYACQGGDGIAGFRISGFWQWTAEVGGCTLGNSLPRYWSGDSLTFMTGPQWIVHSTSRWSPHVHLRLGGQKITMKYCQEGGVHQPGLSTGSPCATDPSGVARHFESTGFALSTGAGVDYRVNRAFAVRVANLDYIHNWLAPVANYDFNQGIRFTAGLVLRVGTW
jgi:hypothetical protein